MLFFGAIFLAIFVLPSPWGLLAVIVAGILEVGEVGFWIWYSKRRKIQMGAETLIGARGVAASNCRPDGQVRVVGELWQARCARGVDAGDPVRVTGREDLLLLVEPYT